MPPCSLPTRLVAALAVSVAAGALAVPASASVPDAPSDAAPAAHIVALHDSVPSAAAVADEHRRTGDAHVSHVYEHALKGFAARLSPQAHERLVRDPRVRAVVPDGVVRVAETTQAKAPWGLDRVEQRSLPLNGAFRYTRTGAGVTVWVVDTGIRSTHREFGGRVVPASGFTAVIDKYGTGDCHGHGTHVAGTVGGATSGVAKSVTLVPVRVFDCSGVGTWGGIIDGIDHVTAKAPLTAGPDVANASLSGGAHWLADEAVRRSIAAGVTYAVAAGNNGADAGSYSPARVAEALTVGATSSTDARAGWSNHGSVVDLFAPGVSISSAGLKSDTATTTMSGTSMAAPHVAGVAALHLERSPLATPADVSAALIDLATPDRVTDLPEDGRTANRLLFTDY